MAFEAGISEEDAACEAEAAVGDGAEFGFPGGDGCEGLMFEGVLGFVVGIHDGFVVGEPAEGDWGGICDGFEDGGEGFGGDGFVGIAAEAVAVHDLE